jgi:hypothetical protein
MASVVSPSRPERNAQPAHAAESVEFKETELRVAGLLQQFIRPTSVTKTARVIFYGMNASGPVITSS